MRPNLSGIVRIQGRIEEIERRIRPKKELPEPPKQERFVDVLEREEAKKPLPGAVSTGVRIPEVAEGWEAHIPGLAAQYGIDESLIRAVIRMESGGKTDAVSHKGAMGLMQLMPGTAKMLGVDDPFDPVQNLEGGIKYLSQLSDKYNGDLTKTLAAYNAGPGRVDAYGGIPPFAETQKYVRSILALYDRDSEGEN
jgi:soluble lytic murein transglycosylase-like protein